MRKVNTENLRLDILILWKAKNWKLPRLKLKNRITTFIN